MSESACRICGTVGQAAYEPCSECLQHPSACARQLDAINGWIDGLQGLKADYETALKGHFRQPGTQFFDAEEDFALKATWRQYERGRFDFKTFRAEQPSAYELYSEPEEVSAVYIDRVEPLPQL